jgi:hypothetical protein
MGADLDWTLAVLQGESSDAPHHPYTDKQFLVLTGWAA